MTRVLNLRQLNRTLLERQMLLRRHTQTAIKATHTLFALQAQITNPPYLSLHARLEHFQKSELTTLLERREIVRVPSLRSTLHLMTSSDYLQFWKTMQPALLKGLRAFFGRSIRDLDFERVVEAARAELEKGPLPFSKLNPLWKSLEPERDPAALAYVTRSFLPLVMVHPGGVWKTGGSPAYALAPSWLGGELNPDSALSWPNYGTSRAGPLDELIKRYLLAYGPSSVADVQAYLGITGLKNVLERLRPELSVYKNQKNLELFDLPGLAVLEEDPPAPVRFLPEYDNILLAHADRSRIIPDEFRKLVFLSAGRVRATFLLDGYVRGAWRVEKVKKSAALVLDPFFPLSSAEKGSLLEEGERLLHFVEDGLGAFEVRIEE